MAEKGSERQKVRRRETELEVSVNAASCPAPALHSSIHRCIHSPRPTGPVCVPVYVCVRVCVCAPVYAERHEWPTGVCEWSLCVWQAPLFKSLSKHSLDSETEEAHMCGDYRHTGSPHADADAQSNVHPRDAATRATGRCDAKTHGDVSLEVPRVSVWCVDRLFGSATYTRNTTDVYAATRAHERTAHTRAVVVVDSFVSVERSIWVMLT